MLETVLRSPSGRTCLIGGSRSTAVIGERINPTGRKEFSSRLIQNDFSLVREEARRQVEAGADILDVNVGAAQVDEERVLAEIVRMLGDEVDVPLCLDSSKPRVLEAALEICPGKPLINSVTGESPSLDQVLPVVKARGAAVIGLCMDENGIPPTAGDRLRIAANIVNRAAREGIPPEDVLIDCLTMTVASDHTAALTTLEAMQMVRKEIGVNLVLGASNVSFGLPDRRTINMAFLALAVNAGLTAVILDPTVPGITRILRATDLLLGRDEWAMHYLQDYRRYGEQ